MLNRPLFSLAFCALVLGSGEAAPAADPGVSLIGTASIPGTARDLSGLSAVLAKDTPHDLLGSFGSGIDFTGKDDLYIAVDDRGPGDGIAQFRCRYQTFRITMRPGTFEPLRVELVSTTLLRDRDWQPLVGFTGEFDRTHPERSLRYDPEGVRVRPGGTLLISDEYGPWIDEFSADGIQVRRILPPAKFLCTAPAKDPKDEMPPKVASGRQANRGFEGLALSPDGATAYAMLQSPLVQDHALDEKNKRIGENIRLLVLPLDGSPTREVVYPLQSAKAGVNEILAVGSTTFIVLERDGGAGSDAAHRGLYLIDISGADDVSGVERLPRSASELASAGPGGRPIAPVRKRPLVNFMDPSYALAGPAMPEKIEGVTFGPTLPDGRRTLIVTSDNDLKPEQPSWFWAFAIEPGALSFE